MYSASELVQIILERLHDESTSLDVNAVNKAGVCALHYTFYDGTFNETAAGVLLDAGWCTALKHASGSVLTARPVSSHPRLHL